MRVALYIRVSTEEQAKEGFSLAAQREKLMQYAILHDWTVVGIYMDEGLSAKDMKRPELKKMLTHMDDGYFDGIMVYKLDRLSRSVVDLFSLVDRMKQRKIEFISYMDNVDTSTATGRMFFGILAVIAQFERENIAERVKMGMEQRAREGKFHGGIAPYGYVSGENGTLVIHEEEAAIVRRIFEKYLSGEGVAPITRWLNSLGIKSKKNVQWYTNTVRTLLDNPIYHGAIRHNVGEENYFEVDDSVPAIISKELFDQVQVIRSAQVKLHPRTISSDFVFTGVLYCPRCGHKMSGGSSKTKGKKYLYYRCPYVHHAQCDMPKISAMRLEKAFMEYLGNVFDEDTLREISATSPVIDHSDEIDLLKRELQKIKERRKKWQLLFADDLISIEEYKERTEEDGERESEIRSELERLEQNETESEERSQEDVIKALKQVTSAWNIVDVEQKRVLLHLLIESMSIEYDKDTKRLEIKDVVYKK